MMDDQFIPVRGDRYDVPNVAILMTDGKANRDKYRTIRDAEQARENGIKIYTVGISEDVDEDEIRLISCQPQKENFNYFMTTDFNTLQMLRDIVGQQVCDSVGKCKLLSWAPILGTNTGHQYWVPRLCTNTSNQAWVSILGTKLGYQY